MYVILKHAVADIRLTRSSTGKSVVTYKSIFVVPFLKDPFTCSNKDIIESSVIGSDCNVPKERQCT